MKLPLKIFAYKGRKVDILPGYSNMILRAVIDGKIVDAGGSATGKAELREIDEAER
jgi:hypothetical protein